MISIVRMAGLVMICEVLAACSGGGTATASSSSPAGSGTSSSVSSSSVTSSGSSASSRSSQASSLSSVLSSSSSSSVSSAGSSSSSQSSVSSGASSSSSVVSVSCSGTSAPDTVGSGALNHAAFTVLPNYGSLGTEWVNGETRLIKDNSSAGSGDLFGFTWSDAGALNLIVSSDNGVSWNKVATHSTTANRILAITQDSHTCVHAISWGSVSDSGYYTRIALAYDANRHISDFSVASSFALPSHGNQGIEKRADIKMVTNSGNAETIVYSIGLTTSLSARDIKVYMAKASSLAPSSFTGIDGTGSDTKVFDSCNYNCSGILTFQTHNHTALFAQNSATHDLYLFEGPIDGDYGFNDNSITSANTIYVTRLSSGSSGWTPGATSVVSSNNKNGITPELMSVASGGSYAWVMYIDPLNGIKFGRVDSSGAYSESAVTSPDNTQSRNGWGVFTVSSDDSKIWAIWNTLGALGASPSAAEGYWNGTSWTKFADSGGSDSMGMAGVSGWKNG
ncbi:MAG TPA: hypothetical protein VHL14_02930, partial [Steroidobacteraceae bacterium]|nr:hypothetical protein [Steroidobacteraceae bacterium]